MCVCVRLSSRHALTHSIHSLTPCTSFISLVPSLYPWTGSASRYTVASARDGDDGLGKSLTLCVRWVPRPDIDDDKVLEVD